MQTGSTMSRYKRDSVTYLAPSRVTLPESRLNRLSPIYEDKQRTPKLYLRQRTAVPRLHLPEEHHRVPPQHDPRTRELNNLLNDYLQRAEYMKSLFKDLQGRETVSGETPRICKCCMDRNKENQRKRPQMQPLRPARLEPLPTRREFELPASRAEIRIPYPGRPEDLKYLYPTIDFDLKSGRPELLRLREASALMDSSVEPDALGPSDAEYQRCMARLRDTIQKL